MDIIFDIDGTVANLDHRLGLVRSHPRNYEAFEAAVAQDGVIEHVKYLYDSLLTNGVGTRILFASGRSERCREETTKWLYDNGFKEWEELYMRPDKIEGTDRKDTRPDTVIKAEILEHMRADGYDPKICFDDRIGYISKGGSSVVQMWPKNGVFCFCVNQGLVEF